MCSLTSVSVQGDSITFVFSERYLLFSKYFHTLYTPLKPLTIFLFAALVFASDHPCVVPFHRLFSDTTHDSPTVCLVLPRHPSIR